MPTNICRDRSKVWRYCGETHIVGPMQRPSFGRCWPIWADLGHILADAYQLLAELDQLWVDMNHNLPSSAKLGEIWTSFVRWRPDSVEPISTHDFGQIWSEIRQVEAEADQLRVVLGQVGANVDHSEVEIGQVWATFEIRGGLRSTKFALTRSDLGCVRRSLDRSTPTRKDEGPGRSFAQPHCVPFSGWPSASSPNH